MKVAFLVPSLHGGGAEFVAREWASFLRSSGVITTVFTTHEAPSPDTKPLGGKGFIGRIIRLRKALKQDEFDFLIALMPHWNLLALVSTIGLRARPRVLISGRTMETGARRAGNNKRIELTLARLLYHRCDAYIAISHPTGAEAMAMYGIRHDQLWVVPNPAAAKIVAGAHLAQLAPRPIQSGDPIHIVVPGRLNSGKRPTLAVQVACRVSTKLDRTVHIHFFGTGPASEDVRSEPRPDSVLLTTHGWVENWFDEVPPGAVVLLPSYVEGFANVLVEAAASRIPSVASSRALGICDAIVPGITGYLAAGDSIEEYANAVIDATELRLTDSVTPWVRRFSTSSSGTKLLDVLAHLSGSRA